MSETGHMSEANPLLNAQMLDMPHANNESRASRSEAEAAIRTLISWAGDSPDRSGVLETPARVAKAFEEWFAGYAIDLSF